MAVKLISNHSYLLTYKLNHSWSSLLQLLLKKARLIKSVELADIYPLLILDLRSIDQQAYQSLILDHQNQVWVSYETINQLTDDYFGQLAYSYNLWQSFLQESTNHQMTDIPYVFGKHIFLKLKTNDGSGYHWLNISKCQQIKVKKSGKHREIHFEILNTNHANHYYHFIIPDDDKRIQNQIDHGLTLQEKFWPYMIKNLDKFETMNHFNMIDPKDGQRKHLKIEIDPGAIQAFLNLSQVLQINQIKPQKQEQILRKFIKNHGYYPRKDNKLKNLMT